MDKFLSEIQYFYQHRKNCKVYIKTVNVALDDKEDEKFFYDIFSPMCDMINIENVCQDFEGVDYEQIQGDSKEEKLDRYGYRQKQKKVCDALFMYRNIQTNGEADCCGFTYPPISIGNIYQKRLKDI